MQALVQRFQIIISAIKSSTNTFCMTKQAMSTHGQRSTSFLEGCSGASLPVVTGKVCTPVPHNVLKISFQSLNVRIHTYLFFGISKAVTATFTNVLVTLQKHLYKTVTRKTSVMNLNLSLFTSSKRNLTFLEKPNVATKKKYCNHFNSLICHALENKRHCMNVKLPRILPRL